MWWLYVVCGLLVIVAFFAGVYVGVTRLPYVIADLDDEHVERLAERVMQVREERM